MDSPTEQALTAYAPVPPPPISSSGNRPFLRSAVACAEPCNVGTSLTATPRSTRCGPSPSWFSLNDSSDCLHSPVPTPLQLSAPQMQNLEVVAAPPSMPRAGCCPSPPSSLSLSSLAALPPTTAASNRDGALSRSTLKTLKVVAAAHTAAGLQKSQSTPLTRSTSPPTRCRREYVTETTSPQSRDASSATASAVSVPGSGVGGAHVIQEASSTFFRSDSFLATGDLAAPVDLPAHPPIRCGSTTREASCCSSTAYSTPLCSLPREDQQPALPQRVLQTPLSLFVDCAVPISCSSPTLHHTSVQDGGGTSSSDVSSSSRTWGCQRGPHVAFASPVSVTPPSSSDLIVASSAEKQSVAVLRVAGFTPVPPPPPPSCSPAAIASSASGAAAPSVPAAGGAPRRHRRSTLSPAGPALPSTRMLTEARNTNVTPEERINACEEKHEGRFICPPPFTAGVLNTFGGDSSSSTSSGSRPTSSSLRTTVSRHVGDEQTVVRRPHRASPSPHVSAAAALNTQAKT